MPEEMTLRMFRCDVCGAENETSGETCDTCGAAAPDDDGPTKFRLSLIFASEDCPACGATGAASPCQKCGSEIPAPEPNAATKARMSALAPLEARARTLVASFDDIPDPHITVTPSQLAAAIVDARVPGRTLELIAFARSVDDLDLEDPAAIGGETRRRLAAMLDEVEQLRDFSRLLAEFEAAEEVAELPALVGRLGRGGAVIIEKVLSALVTETPADAAAAARELQAALGSPAGANEITALLAALPELDAPDDVNARVATVTGRKGTYTDELGLPSPELIFAAPPGENTSFAALALGARRYMSHLLDTPEEVSDAQAMLILPAVQLALLDRPFEHHRRAELVRELLRDAAAKDPTGLDAVLSAYEDHAGLAFETAMRVRRQIRLLATGEVLSPIDFVESSVEMYRQLAESHFRAAVRCVLAARAVLTGKNPPPESPLLGDIEKRLTGWHDELGRSLDGVIERHLRNGEAHQDYRVDPATLEIVLQNGSRLTVDDVAKLTEDLGGAVAAIEAAVSCHTINTGRTPAPHWLAAGESPRLVELVARMVAAGLGITIENFTTENGTVTVIVPEGSEIGQWKARTVLAAARPLAPSASMFETYKGGRLMAAFNSEVFDRWSAAPEDVQPLVMIEMLYESSVRCGANEADTLRDAIATCLRFTINEPISTPPTPREIRTIDHRLKVTARMAARHGASSGGELSEPLAQVKSARESLKRATKSQDFARRFGKSMVALSMWADQHMGTLLSDDQ
jgi:hypothetical protein